MNSHYFTFGTNHSCTHPALRGMVADYWVEVRCDDGDHRHHFMEAFASLYLDSKISWAFEYDKPQSLKIFPGGCLAKYTVFTLKSEHISLWDDLDLFFDHLPVTIEYGYGGITFHHPDGDECLIVPGETFSWDGTTIRKHRHD